MEKGDGFIWTVVVYLTSLWKLQGLIASFKLKLVESSLCLLWLKISFVLLMNSVYVNSLQIIISSFVNMTFVFNYHSTGFLFLLQCSLHSHPHETATKACLTILQKVSCLHWFTIYIYIWHLFYMCQFSLEKKNCQCLLRSGSDKYVFASWIRVLMFRFDADWDQPRTWCGHSQLSPMKSPGM